MGLFTLWVVGLTIAFAVVQWSLHTMDMPGQSWSFFGYLYVSGGALFTLGYSDIPPDAVFGRYLAVLEGGLGFAFLAVVISYLPVLYQAFSRREAMISLLDARSGSPPSASQTLLRVARAKDFATLNLFLVEWEHWAAELLESHLTFPVLSYYRSQHDNQSWLAALTMMLDTCALLLAEVDAGNAYQAQLTFAIARHAAVDLALVLKTRPRIGEHDRLPAADHRQLRQKLAEAGLVLRDEKESTRLAELRVLYEPFVVALGEQFFFSLPRILVEDSVADNWQRSAWMRQTPGIGSLPLATTDDEHFV